MKPQKQQIIKIFLLFKALQSPSRCFVCPSHVKRHKKLHPSLIRAHMFSLRCVWSLIPLQRSLAVEHWHRACITVTHLHNKNIPSTPLYRDKDAMFSRRWSPSPPRDIKTLPHAALDIQKSMTLNHFRPYLPAAWLRFEVSPRWRSGAEKIKRGPFFICGSKPT